MRASQREVSRSVFNENAAQLVVTAAAKQHMVLVYEHA